MEFAVRVPSAEEVARLEGRQLDDALRQLNVLLAQVEASIAQVVGRCRQTGAYLDDGFRTVASWAAAQCNWPIAEARRHARIAAALRDLPSTAEVLAHGEIGVAQAEEISRLHANPRTRAAVVAAERSLLDEAAQGPFDDFERTCRRFADLVDADGAHRSHEQVHSGRTASTVVVGDEFHLRARGGTLAGEEISEILAHFTDVEFASDCDAVRGEGEGDIPRGQLPRTHNQRRFDALLAVFRTAASAEPALAREPQVSIIVDAGTYTGAFAELVDRAGDLGDGSSANPAEQLASTGKRLCETAHGVPVDPLQAVFASLVGTVRRFLVDPASGLVIDVGRRQRPFRGAAREAVRISGRRCLWPGCTVPAGHCEIDHCDPWSASQRGAPGGCTSPDNGGLLCARHNRFKNRGYTTRRDPQGHWHVYRPDGTELAPRPGRRLAG